MYVNEKKNPEKIEKKTTPPTHPLLHSNAPTIDVEDQLYTAVFPDSCGQPDC